MFLKISQNLQENIIAKVSLLKGDSGERVNFSVKKQKNVQLFFELLEKGLSYKLFFVCFFLILFKPFSTGKIEITFQIPVIPQTLNMNK